MEEKPAKPSENVPKQVPKQLSRDMKRSFSPFEIKMSAEDAIADLRSRINPKTARWAGSHQFFMHLVYTFIIMLVFSTLLIPVCNILITLIGFLNAVLIGIIGTLCVLSLSLYYFRDSYYHSLQMKKQKPWYTIPLMVLLSLAYLIAGLPLTWYVLAGIFGVNSPLLLCLGVPLWASVNVILFWKLVRIVKESIEYKKEAGIEIGTSYQHYVNSFRYATAVGSGQNKQDEPKLVGQTRDFRIDYAGEPNPHALILGGAGSGKTTTLRAFLVRASNAYGTKFLVIDWNGESEGWAGSINATVWKAGKQFRINPFLLRGDSIADRASGIAELFQFGSGMTPLQANMVRSMVLPYYSQGKTPDLLSIWKEVNKIANDRKETREKRQYAEWIDQRLRTVQRVFGTEPEEFWDGILSRNNVISLAGLNESEKSTVSYAIFQRIVEYFNKQPELNQKQRLMVVMDEGWAVLQSQRHEDQVYESLPSRIVRLGRKYGFGMVVSTQQIEDIPQPFINSSALRVIHSYRNENFLDSARETFGFGDFESAYLGTAGIGEAFIFDQARAMKGQNFGDYVKVRPLDESELARIRGREKVFVPPSLNEPDMPIDMPSPEAMKWPPPADRPTPTQFITIYTIFNNPGKERVYLVESIRAAGITSNATIYGSPGRPGLFETLVKMGYATQDGDKYALTVKGLRWVDPALILEPEKKHLGSSTHVQLLTKTIKELQAKHMLVLVPPVKDQVDECIDLLAYPMDTKRKHLWDDSARRGYEIQTMAPADVIKSHGERADRYSIPLTWVSWDSDILDLIKKMRAGKDEYWLMKL